MKLQSSSICHVLTIVIIALAYQVVFFQPHFHHNRRHHDHHKHHFDDHPNYLDDINYTPDDQNQHCVHHLGNDRGLKFLPEDGPHF